MSIAALPAAHVQVQPPPVRAVPTDSISALRVVQPVTPLARLVQELGHPSAPRAPSEPNWCSEPVRPSNATQAPTSTATAVIFVARPVKPVRLLHRTVSAALLENIFLDQPAAIATLPASPVTDQLPLTASHVRLVSNSREAYAFSQSVHR